jgi:hypothetical protein
MTVLMVPYEVKEESVAEVESGVEQMITAIEQEQPKGIRYAIAKLPDGVSFVGILELVDGVDNPLPGIAVAREFQENLRDWVVGEPPAPQPLQMVGSYNLFK